MLDVEIEIRNYRCIGDEPVKLRVGDGFTALVGTNNSGKSSLLRILYEIRPLITMLAYESSGREILFGNSANYPWFPTLNAGERVFRVGANRPIDIKLTVHDGPMGVFGDPGQPWSLTVTSQPNGRQNSELRTFDGRILGRKDQDTIITAETVKSFQSAMDVLARARYVGPFRNAINIGGQENYYDINTGEAFIKSFSEFKSGPNPEQNEAVFQLTEDIRRIFGFKSLDINAATDKKTLQLTVDGRSFRLAEQGAGLAHFVVVLVNVLVSRPSLLLIDEPELNLHASLQLDFLSTLARYTEHGVVFATHSLGLARTAADRIYTLSKPPGGTSRLRNYESDKELVTLLGQLSFNNRPDLGFNRVLLVEGRSDLLALMQLLRLYGKEHEVLLIALHGDELINGGVRQELMELLRISENIQYLIDSERAEPEEELSKNRKEFMQLCRELGIPGCVLNRRALENYFPERALNKAFGDAVSALQPFEKKASKQGWPKNQNWRVTAEMMMEELNGTDLGDFLKQL